LKDTNKFNQFGGSVGGPIWKNKVFFFFNYETVREPTYPSTGSGWFDTPAFDALASSGGPIAQQYLSFPGNTPVTTGIVASATCGDRRSGSRSELQRCSGGLNVGTPESCGFRSARSVRARVSLWRHGLRLDQLPKPPAPAATAAVEPPENLGTTADIAEYITSNPTTHTAVQYNGRLDADVTSKDRIGFAIYWVPQSPTTITALDTTTSSITARSTTLFPSSGTTPSRPPCSTNFVPMPRDTAGMNSRTIRKRRIGLPEDSSVNRQYHCG
jgi:hypothetical protein